jgi:hypothetical protein
MVLFLLAAVAAAGATLCLRVVDTAKDNVLERASLAARYAAQAGVERARWSLARDAEYDGESMRFGAFDVAVTVTCAADGTRAVHAVASSPAMSTTADATLRLTAGLPAVTSWHDAR